MEESGECTDHVMSKGVARPLVVQSESSDGLAELCSITKWMNDHGDSIRNYLRAFVQHDVVEDLLQEVFLAAIQNQSCYREEGKARAYLIRIAQNQFRAYYRKHRRERLLDDSQWKELEPEQSNLATESSDTDGLNRELINAIRNLPMNQKHVLVLRYFVELDFQTIATTLGCPINTAHSHSRRGIDALRQKFNLIEMISNY